MKKCQCENCRRKQRQENMAAFGWGYQPECHGDKPRNPPPKKP